MSDASNDGRGARSSRTVEGLKKEAKDWLRDLRRNDASAHARWLSAMGSSAADPNLRDVQHAIAREHGFVDWISLKAALEPGREPDVSSAQRADWFLENACIDPVLTNGPSQQQRRRNAAMRILRNHPEVVRANIHTAVVGGDVGLVAEFLATNPKTATERGGPVRARYNKDRESLWSPLLHLCYGRLPIAAASDNALTIARMLLERGADPNDYFEVGSHPSRYTALTGLVGGGEESTSPHPKADELLQLLLDFGANPIDTQLLYNASLGGRTTFRWFDVLYEASVKAGREAEWVEPNWNPKKRISQFDWLLLSAKEQGDEDRMAWLEARGARPDAFENKAPTTVEPDEFAKAAFALDEVKVRAIVAQNPAVLQKFETLFAAAENNRSEVVGLLLSVGVPIDVQDSSGQQALHIAASANAFDVVRLLIERGANQEARESNWSNTPLDHAIYGNQTEMIELLGSYSRDVFLLAWVGNVERLRVVLRDGPSLATQIVDGQTPLMSLPDDEIRAVEVVNLLLENGADASVVDERGHTAAYYASKRGLEEAAAILRVGQWKNGTRNY